MAEINWTLEAQYWLKEIHDYIAQDKPDVAERVLDEIINKVQILIEFPETGFRYEIDSGEDIRILL